MLRGIRKHFGYTPRTLFGVISGYLRALRDKSGSPKPVRFSPSLGCFLVVRSATKNRTKNSDTIFAIANRSTGFAFQDEPTSRSTTKRFRALSGAAVRARFIGFCADFFA